MKNVGTHQLIPREDLDPKTPEGRKYYECNVCGLIVFYSYKQYIVSAYSTEPWREDPKRISCQEYKNIIIRDIIE